MDPEQTEVMVGANSDMPLEETADIIAEDLGIAPPEQTEEEKAELAAKTAAKPGEATPAKPEAKKTAVGAAAEGAAQSLETPAPAAAATDAAPDTWRKEVKEAWAALPPAVKEEIRRREGDIAKFVGETREPLTIAKAFTAVIEPYVELFTKTGIDPWRYTAALIQTDTALRYGTPEQKLGIVRNIIAATGLKPEALAAGQAAPDELQQRFNWMAQRIQQLEAGVTGVTSAVHSARAAELTQEVMAFGNDAAHPFFWDVAEESQRLIETGAAQSLEQAYTLAVNANPVTRGKLIDLDVERRQKNLSDLEKARMVKAEKAASANVKSRRAGRAAQPTGTIDDTLRETLAEINART